MEHHLKLDLDINLFGRASELINRQTDNGYKSNSITREELFTIVPELDRLDFIFQQYDAAICFASVMTILPGTYGLLHVDGEPPTEIHSLKFNIPIINGDKMITRWYDLSGLPYDRIDWKFDRSNLRESELWFLEQHELLTSSHCVDQLRLAAPHLINSGVPHNVDGRHSSDVRTILSMNIAKISEERSLEWNERQTIVDAVARYNQLHQNSSILCETCYTK